MFARHLKASCEEGPVTVQRLIRAQPASGSNLRGGAEVIMMEAKARDLLAISLETFFAEALQDLQSVGLA